MPDVENVFESLNHVVPEYDILAARGVDMDNNMHDGCRGCRGQVVLMDGPDSLHKLVMGFF
jgi:hypothetical protein